MFDDKESDTTVTVGMPGMDELLYAEKFQSPYKHPGGTDRLESTCSDEYLAKKEVPSNRYYRPSVHIPTQPFKYKDPPKAPDRRFNKPKPNPE